VVNNSPTTKQSIADIGQCYAELYKAIHKSNGSIAVVIKVFEIEKNLHRFVERLEKDLVERGEIKPQQQTIARD